MEDKVENVVDEAKQEENKEKWDQIQALDLNSITDKYASKFIERRTLELQSTESWWWNLWNDAKDIARDEASESVPEIESEYRQFLYLLAINPGKTVVPWSQELDDFWHLHILDTGKYAADCGKLFGKFIHHNPNLPKGTDATAFNETKEMYKEAFTAAPSCSSAPASSCSSTSSSCSSGSSSSCSSSSCSSGSSCGSSCGGGGD